MILLVINCLLFKEASFIKIVACIIEDSEEKERIVLKKSTIVFLFKDDRDNVIDGIENSINPLNRYEMLLVKILFIMLQGIENITIIPKIFNRVLKE